MKNVLTHALFAVVLSLWLTMSAWAGLDEGEAAIERQDWATAFEEFQPLAKRGIAAAQSWLGWLYEIGHYVEQDYIQAVILYRMAAEQGYAPAQYRLGIMYGIGRGVPQDYAEKMKLYRMAAEQGYANALATMGFLYEMGRHVPQDYIQAHMWYNLAAALDTKKQTLGLLGRLRVAKIMTPTDISKAQRLAREWFEEHGE